MGKKEEFACSRLFGEHELDYLKCNRDVLIPKFFIPVLILRDK